MNKPVENQHMNGQAAQNASCGPTPVDSEKGSMPAALTRRNFLFSALLAPLLSFVASSWVPGSGLLVAADDSTHIVFGPSLGGCSLGA